MRLLMAIVVVLVCAVSGAQTFANPIIPHGADPSVVMWKGSYVSVQGCGRDGGPAICLRMAKSLPELKTTRPVTVWQAPPHGPNGLDVWAPQVDVLGGELYIYYAADAKGDNDHRLFALVPRDRAKPMGAWVEGNTGAPGGQLVTDWKSVWAIDPDVFQASDGKLYLLYSCRQDNSGTDFGRSQSICLAPMKDPLHLEVDPRTGKSVVELSQPRQAWERRGWPTQEGPFGYTHDDVDYILYSGSFSGNPDQYAEGMLVNDHPPQPHGFTNAMTNPAAWRKEGPIFDGHHAAYGTASSVLVASADGAQLWHVYHGTDCLTSCERVAGKTWRDRSDRAQPAGWTDGELVLGYPVDFKNTDGTGRDVPVEGASKDWPRWGAAFGDAAEGNATDGRVLGSWSEDGDAITSDGAGVAQRFFQRNPNLQQYVVSTKIKRVSGAGKYGVYATYVGHANFVTVMIDGASVVTDAVVDGKDQGTKACALPNGFASDGENALAVEVADGVFRVLVNEEPVSGACQGRQFALLGGQPAEHGTNGQAGVRAENVAARFAAFHVVTGAPVDSRKTVQLFALRNVSTKMNLDNGCAGGCGGKPKNDAPVIQAPAAAPYPATISSTQLWELHENRDGSYAVMSALSGMCVEVRDATVLQEPCAKGEKQAWMFEPADGGFVLANKGSMQALAALDTVGMPVALSKRSDSTLQQWMLVAQ